MFRHMLTERQEEWIENPSFENRAKVHNWRNHVMDAFKNKWHKLSVETRQVIIIMAEGKADQEEWE